MGLHVVFPEDLGLTARPLLGLCERVNCWSVSMTRDVTRATFAVLRARNTNAQKQFSLRAKTSGNSFASVGPLLHYRTIASLIAVHCLLTCGCNRDHSTFQGLNDQGEFVSSQHSSLGTQFWVSLLAASMVLGTGLPLRDGRANYYASGSAPYVVNVFGFRM